MFSGVFVGILFWIDSIVLGYFDGAIAVGFYNAAIPIIALFSIAQEIFMHLLVPLTVKAYTQNKISEVREISKQVAKWIFMLDLPLFIIIFLFPGAIINLLFGSEYLVAEKALQILAIGAIFSFTMFISNNFLFILGKSKLMLVNLVVASIINLILNIILVPKYGLVGAAISTAIVTILLTLVLMFQSWYFIKIIPLKRKMLRILLVSLIPLFILFILKGFFIINIFSLIVLGILFSLIYILLLFSTRCLDKNDWEIVKKLKEQRKRFTK